MNRVAAIVALLALATPTWADPDARPPSPVKAAPVVQKMVREGRTFVGSVTPLRRAELSSGVEGFVKTLHVREGQRVEQGAVISELEPDVIVPQLDAARAELERIESEIDELENGTRQELLDEARARVAEGEVAVETAKRKLETAMRLRASKHVSGDEVRDAEDLVTAAEAALRRLRAGLALLEAGIRKERVDQARARKKGQLAEVARLEALEKRHTLRAPFACYVIEEHTDEGAWLSTGAPVVTVEALDTVRVRFPVLEDYATAIEPGVDVAVYLGAFPDRVFAGHIERIVPSADPRARTLPVDILVTNERVGGGVLIKPGMFARTTLPVGESVSALLVPLDAIVLGGRTPTVFVIGEDGAVMPVPVELGPAIDGLAVVTGALEPGMQVVTEGNERLRPGQVVRVMD